jgi:hypothetical protein
LTHRFDFEADLRDVFKRLASNETDDAPLAQQEEQRFRTPQIGVQGVDGAPDSGQEDGVT